MTMGVETPHSPKRLKLYVKDWLTFYNKRQRDLINELGFDKAEAHYAWHDGRPYINRDRVEVIAKWLELEPYELFMPPEVAIRARFSDGASPSNLQLANIERLIIAMHGDLRRVGADVKAEKPRTFSITVGPGYVRPERKKTSEN